MTTDLTAANAAAIEAAPFAYPDEIVEKIVTAAAPAIEAAVRAQIAAELEALDDNDFLKGLVGLNGGAQAMLEWAAATARGES